MLEVCVFDQSFHCIASSIELLAVSRPSNINACNLHANQLLKVNFYLQLSYSAEMGIVFGVTGTQEPPYTIVSNPPNYQVRIYSPYLIAEVPQLPGQDNNSFTILAKYIGVFGKPENQANQAMAMTSPVITVEPVKMAMTSPVVNAKDTMSFVLPFSYTSLEQLPVPTDKRIVLRAVPRRLIAVKVFSGWYTAAEGHKQLMKLKEWLAADQIIPEDSVKGLESPTWSVAQYHPPFTLPFLRRNEIWVDLDEKNEKIKAMVDAKAT